jgi:glycolate dehydrogenase iron-sulfur subunit
MRTNFSPAQLADPHIAAAELQLRACVHCGICTATCPTYVLLGDELDGPRGRIQLIQDMLERNAKPSAKVTTHIDRCLSCLACVSACPSGVDYPRLIDAARQHIERSGSRPLSRRVIRRALGFVLPRRRLLSPLLALGRLMARFARFMPEMVRAPIEVAAALPRAKSSPTGTIEARTPAGRRVALHMGCVQEVVAPQITAAAARVLERHGFDVTTVQGTGCCGALNHHLGQARSAERHATALVGEIASQERERPFEAIVTTASGCGAVMRDYGFQLGDAAAAATASRTRDIVDVLRDVPLRAGTAHIGVRVAYHAACSLVHGMKQAAAAPQILRKLGFDVVEPRDTLCCGSAGVYNVLEPAIAGQLQQRKAAALMAAKPLLIATGNIGCLAQIAAAVRVPVVHPIELIDWATGGPKP